ncbi:MAG: hypothetical protein ABSH22_04455 [Tepidisphaeraceae bacterium]|jgi:hypothetical protein
MNYEVILDAWAQHNIAHFSPSIKSKIYDQLKRLEADPVRLSKRSHFPYRERCQMFDFTIDLEGGEKLELNAQFQYEADERTLYVWTIGHSRFTPPPSGDSGPFPHD